MEATKVPRVKVCCIASAAEAWAAIRRGASALGLVSRMPSGPGVIDDATIAAVAAIVPPGVSAFLLTCEQEVDGRRYLPVEQYPATLRYQSHVLNAHPTQTSDVLSAVDPLLSNEGFSFTCGPISLPVGGCEAKLKPPG